MPDYWTTLLTLIAMLLASALMLHQLLRRHTSGRARFQKWEWSVNRGFHAGPLGVVNIDALDEIREHVLQALEHYVSRDRQTSIYRLHSVGRDMRVQTWHVLVRKFPVGYSTPIALRPTTAAASLVDLMKLQLFPKLSSETRFNVYGLRAIDARQLATGPARALLPPDIGLIRNADSIILDFTTRPFDPTELSRVYAVGEQIVDQLLKGSSQRGA